MQIERNEENGKVTLALTGRLDTTTAPSLETALLPELNGGVSVNLDFLELGYVSSAGLRVLLIGEKAAKARDVQMTISNVSEEIMEVFDMTGFSDILNIC